ncbi:hypothetical protein [Paraburkholderia flagellata]|uniref:hypothetical protein n=1 Tax=Paraburkholderia flagellata TaxID=2883241 RepID=UPI001F1C290A|nr:hypothetical protein [Paraburkholderia flagellata]
MDLTYLKPASYVVTQLEKAYQPFPSPTEKTEDCALAVSQYLQEKGVTTPGILAVATEKQTGDVYVAFSAGLLSGLNAKFPARTGGYGGKRGYDAVEASLQTYLQGKYGKTKLPSVVLCATIQEAMARQCTRLSCAEPKILSCLRQLGRKISSLCVIGYLDYEQNGYDVISSGKMTYLHPCRDCRNFGGNYL